MVISNTAIDADGSYFFLIVIGRLICGNSQRLLLNLALETLWIWVGSSFLVFYGGINSISSICSINKVLLDRSSLGKKSFLDNGIICIPSIVKADSEKIGVLTRAIRLLSLEVVLYFCKSAIQSYRQHRLIGPTLVASL